uniref:ribonuclease H n=1 Tax=viral metagenome TaxID=1070528 RepID=A0A6C0CEU0_9ZZZZ
MSGDSGDSGVINIYIDGSCIHNGSPNAIAGYGVYFKADDERNEYARVVGKQTNNTGELTAFIRAVEKMKDEIIKEPPKKIAIYSDSEYVIKCAGAYGDRLFKNDWKTVEGKVPPNLKLIQRIREIYRPYKKHIELHHIKAHTGFNDEHSIGNAEADRLANLAVGVVVAAAVAPDYIDNTLISNIKQPSNKNYINIGFDYKDAVKKLGAKWDLRCKKWYYEDNISEENITAILEIEKMSLSSEDKVADGGEATLAGVDIEIHKKIYVKIPFHKKNDAKKHGCRWDAQKKSWYYMSNLEKNKIDSIIKLEE